MKLLNLCAGANRVQSPEWVNLDQLFPVLPEGSPERNNLLSESNYVEFDVLSGPLPFKDGEFDSLMASHCFEHWSCGESEMVLKECYRILKPGGMMLISVPDASYFRKVYDFDTPEKAVELFGEPIHLPDGEDTFTGYALWCPGKHKTILTEDAVWHYLKRAAFGHVSRVYLDAAAKETTDKKWWKCHERIGDFGPAMIGMCLMVTQLNRLPFSLVMAGVKE